MKVSSISIKRKKKEYLNEDGDHSVDLTRVPWRKDLVSKEKSLFLMRSNTHIVDCLSNFVHIQWLLSHPQRVGRLVTSEQSFIIFVE